MGLLADAFSYGNGLKRKVNGLLADPVGTLELGVNRLGEDQNKLLGLLKDVMPAGRYVAPEVRKNALKELADYGSQVGMAGTVGGKFVYPQEKALATAQRNAAKPVSEGGLGLRPDNTPMERAQAMGFTDDAYHGTNLDFSAFDMSKVGSSTVLPFDAPRGAYFAKQPEITARYAKGEGSNVIPAMLNKDGVLLDNSKIIVTNQPQNIRSRFAAFDPLRKHEADLLAGMLPFSALVDEDNRNKLRGLLAP